MAIDSRLQHNFHIIRKA